MKWTRTTPITAAEANAEPIEDQLFGPSFERRQRVIRARGERAVSIDRDPWKKPNDREGEVNDTPYKELLTHFDSIEQIDELLSGLALQARGTEKAQLLQARVKFREKAAQPQNIFDSVSNWLTRKDPRCL